MTSAEFKIICRMITELETRFNKKLDGFGDRFIGMSQGFSILPPPRQGRHTELCAMIQAAKFALVPCAARCDLEQLRVCLVWRSPHLPREM